MARQGLTAPGAIVAFEDDEELVSKPWPLAAEASTPPGPSLHFQRLLAELEREHLRAVHEALRPPGKCQVLGGLAVRAQDDCCGDELRSPSALRRSEQHSPSPLRTSRSSLRKSRTKLFVEVEKMKETVQDSIMKKSFSSQDFYKKNGIFRSIATNNVFQEVILACIALNAIWIWVDTDVNQEPVLYNAHPVFIPGENFFCILFTLEWVIVFSAYEKKCNVFRDSWFVLDSVLLTTMILETWIMPMAMAITTLGAAGQTVQDASEDRTYLRLLRLLRLTRMARVSRLLRRAPELMMMIKGMIAAARSVAYTLSLLFIVTYAFAITLKQLTGPDMYIGQKYFQSVWGAMITLLLQGAFLDSVEVVVREIQEESFVCMWVFFFYLALGPLMIMNLLVGVLCEVVSVVATVEKEAIRIQKVKRKMNEIFQIDDHPDMKISKAEFLRMMESPVACRGLKDVEVDVVGLVGFADCIFEPDGVEEIELTLPQFLQVVLRFQKSTLATVMDVVDLRKYIGLELKMLHEEITSEAQELRRLILGSPVAAASRPSGLSPSFVGSPVA